MPRSPLSGGSGPGGSQGTAPDEAASLQLILSIGRAFKFVDDYVRPRMQKHGLTMTEFSVLMVLHHGGPTPLGELSERILLTGASTTYTVKKLEKRGLIVREARSADKRVVMGVITEKAGKENCSAACDRAFRSNASPFYRRKEDRGSATAEAAWAGLYRTLSSW